MRALYAHDPLAICVNLHITCWSNLSKAKPTPHDLFKSSEKFQFWLLNSLAEELKRAEGIIEPGCVAKLPELNITVHVGVRYQVVARLHQSDERGVMRWVASAVIDRRKIIVEDAWYLCMLDIPDRTKLSVE